MVKLSNTEIRKLDDAARAGWLYYVGGNTQDEIAKKLNISRQSAQRMVALSVSQELKLDLTTRLLNVWIWPKN